MPGNDHILLGHMGVPDGEKTVTKEDMIFDQLGKLQTGQTAIWDKVNYIAEHGTAQGREHERRIASLEEKPSRWVSIGAGIVSILGAIIAWMHGKGP